VTVDLSTFVSPQEAWEGISAEMQESFAADPRTTEFGLTLASSRLGELQLRTSVSLPQNPVLTAGIPPRLDRYLNGMALRRLYNKEICNYESLKKLIAAANLRVPDVFHAYLQFRLDQTYGLALASILGLIPRAIDPGIGHPSFVLHSLKRRLSQLDAGQPQNPAVTAELENELAEAYRLMLGGYQAESSFGDGLASRFDIVLNKILAHDQSLKLDWNSREGPYLAVSPTALERILQPLLENAFQAYAGIPEPVAPVTLRLEQLDSGDDGGAKVMVFIEIKNQFNSSIPQNPYSTRIGLMASRRLVEASRGEWNEPVNDTEYHIQSFTLPLLE
jgi:hypothetical protein